MPRIDRVEDLAGAIGSIFQEVAGGRLHLDEGATLVGMLESKRRAMETIDLEKRLRALPFAVRCKDCEEARENVEQRERKLNARRGTS